MLCNRQRACRKTVLMKARFFAGSYFLKLYFSWIFIFLYFRLIPEKEHFLSDHHEKIERTN
ncbi:hypothetical protein C0033_25810 [Clostridium sp. chh4-2]|nr:hypothetical protein C0033_25810 [Clostridium sp. chh4-2]